MATDYDVPYDCACCGKSTTNYLCSACAKDARIAEPEEVVEIDIVFDGPPGPESGRFVEVENSEGKSINFGKWLQRDDGYWVLRFRAYDAKKRGISYVAQDDEG